MDPFKNFKNYFINASDVDPIGTVSKKEQRKNSKFLRSLSNRSSGSDSSPEKPETNSSLLFETLNKELDGLIEHFKANLESIESPVFDERTTTKEDQLYSVSPLCVDTSDTSSNTYYLLTSYAKKVLNKCIIHYKELDKHVQKFDYSPNVKSNGYRSLMSMFEKCCTKLLNVVKQLNNTKSSFLFQFKLNTTFPGTINIKDYQTWVRLMEKIEIVFKVACDIQKIQIIGDQKSYKFHEGPSLFYDMCESDESGSEIETNLLLLGSVHQESFFGRTCGFQFCDSLQTPLTGAAVALASYNDGYEAASVNSINSFEKMDETQGQASIIKSLMSGTKYMIDPELRAKKISKVMKDANVEFCKAFWQLTETDIVQMGSNMITPSLSVNVLKKISLSTPLELPMAKHNESEAPLVTINPPTSSTSKDYVQIRLLSSDMREGMKDLDDLKLIESPALFNSILNMQPTNLRNFNASLPQSPNLILHVHGGGFIAHSSKSHEIYLKPWCKELKIPIVSIDYSLAPEHVFPRASEECFYVYAWCLLNKHSLGWTGEKIICVGDSAGGVLVTNIVQRAINNNIRVPDALIPIYTPFLSTYSISPSRLMSVMDPLLNLGILWRCLAAYSGIDYKKETEKYKSMLDIKSTQNNTDNRQSTMRTSPTMASIIRTTPFKTFLSRTTSNNNNNNKQSPPCTPTPTSTNKNISIRFSRTESTELEIEETFNIDLNSDKKLTQQTEKQPQDILTSKQKERMLQLHKVLGDSVFLIERLRNHPLGRDQYMSPLHSDEKVLAQFPKTYLITTTQDPLLDDSILMYNMLRRLGINCNLDVLDGLHHGFLNFIKNSKECLKASKFVTATIKKSINQLDQEANKIE